MNEAVNGGKCHSLIAKHCRIPLFLIGSSLASRSPTHGIPYLVSDLRFLGSVPGAVPAMS